MCEFLPRLSACAARMLVGGGKTRNATYGDTHSPMTLAAPDHKARQQAHWSGVAAGWAARANWIDRNFAPLADWLAHETGWAPGARVLDVACGAGFPALVAAARVAPGGFVLAADLSPEMCQVTARRSRASGLQNVEVAPMDAEELQAADGSFDAVSNAYGLMFCADPSRAIGEARRVLSPGGRCAVATWAEPSSCPFFSVIAGVAAEHLGLRLPPAGAPGPFRFSSADELARTFQSAGFRDVIVEPLTMRFDCGSVDDYCGIFRDIGWKPRFDALSSAELAAFLRDTAAAAAPYSEGGRLRLTTVSLCARGTR